MPPPPPEEQEASALFYLLTNDALEDPHGSEVYLLRADLLLEGDEWLLDSNRNCDLARLQLLTEAWRVLEKQSHPLQTYASKTISTLIDEFSDAQKSEQVEDADDDESLAEAELGQD